MQKNSISTMVCQKHCKPNNIVSGNTEYPTYFSPTGESNILPFSSVCKTFGRVPVRRLIDFEQSLFFLSPSSETHETRK